MNDPALFAVIPILVGPLQVLLALLPAILVALGGALLGLFRPSTAKQSVKLLWRLKASLLLLVALGFGLVQAVRAVLPRPKAAPTESAAPDWPLFRGGPHRAGAAPGSPAPLAGGVNWAFTSEIKTFYSSPAVVGNRLYVTGADKGVFADRGAVYCLDADTGGLVWTSAPDGFRATFSSPSVSGRFLVVGEGLHYTHDSRVFCLDVTQQGKMLWSHRTSSHVESTACIADGRVCIGAGDDGYYCFALEPGTDGSARVLWHAAHERCPDAETSPVFHEGNVFVGLGLEGNALVCLDAATGREKWRVPTPYPVFTPPTILSNRVIFGMGNGNFIETAEEAAMTELARLKAAGATETALAEAAERLKAGGEVWCVDIGRAEAEASRSIAPNPKSEIRNPKNSQSAFPANVVRWKFKTSEVVLGAIAAAHDGTLCFGTRGGEFIALTADGRERARRPLQVPVLASPAIAGGHVYVVTENGRLYALDRQTLAPAWEMSLGETGPFISSPTIARGHVYVGSQEDGLLCVGTPANALKEPIWTGALGGPGRPGHVDDSPLPENGAVRWLWPPASEEAGASVPAPHITAPAAVLGGLIAVPIATGPRCGLLALTDDAQAPTLLAERWFYATSNGVWLSPALIGARTSVLEPRPLTPALSPGGREGARGAGFQSAGSPGSRSAMRPDFAVPADLKSAIQQSGSPRHQLAFVVDGKPGDADRHLHCLDARTGALRWRVPVASDASGEFVVLDQSLLIQHGPQEVACLDFAGQERWRQPLGTLRGTAAGGNDLAVVALTSAPCLLALDLPTGKELWRVEVTATTGPVVDGTTLFVGTTDGISARRLTDGTPVWQTAIAAPAQPLMLAGATLATVTRSNDLVLLDAQTGHVQTTIPGVFASHPPLLTRDAALFATKDALMRVSFDQPSPERWMTSAGLGEPSSPMVMADSAVYFATPAKGLIKAARIE